MSRKPRHQDPEAAILSAARRCFIERGIDATVMQQVADEARVGRSTLYRYFSNRDELLVAVVKRDIERANEVIRAELAQYDDPADVIVEGIVLALREIPARPILRAVFASARNSGARSVVWQSQLIVEFGEQLFEEVIAPAAARGLLQDRVPPEAMAQWIYRILISLLTLPSQWTDSEHDLRVTLRGLLVPVLLR
ncbi:MAG: helix-turn-helix domain-containing protein [Pseudomonadota bacterium]